MNKPFINRELSSTGITIGYMAVLLVLSVMPDIQSTLNPLVMVSPAVQNLAHVPAYGFLAILWIFNLRSSGTARAQAVIAAMIIAAVYGLLIELLQTSVPGRFPSVLDGLLNVAGIVIFTVGYLLVSSRASITWSRPGSVRSNWRRSLGQFDR